jgi:hypothetical protein
MTRLIPNSTVARLLLVPTIVLALATPPSAQTRIERHKNSYSPQQDVQLGQQAAAEVRKQMPMLDDGRTEDFVEDIGERLIEVIPSEFRQPEFRYSFDVVNLRDINAFALPGGPMFVNRGMIQAARTEGEVAGVMAHELAHVVLRHGTVQATRGQKLQLGAIVGQVAGAIIGGKTGAVVAQGAELTAGGYFLKFGREFEREADLLGAQLLARAGYDPREMAKMFETIERQGGNRGPEWLSSHPNPGNRVQAINREAELLGAERRVTANGDLQSVHARLNQLPQAPTTAQVARTRQQGEPQGRERTGTTGRAMRVEPPSGQWRTHQPGDFLRLSVPANWRAIDVGDTIAYAPEGGYVRSQSGESVFTHGIEVGVIAAQGGNLQQQTEQLIQGFARSNPQLRRQGGYTRTTIGGRQGLTTTLRNVSDATGDTEAVNVSTAQLPDGSLLYLIGVAPADEARAYLETFARVRQTVQLADARR